MSNANEKLSSELFVKCDLSGDYCTEKGERIKGEIALAAYARAEMAKRKFYFRNKYELHDKKPRMRLVLWRMKPDELYAQTDPEGLQIADDVYDPADPLAEAREIIKACCKALKIPEAEARTKAPCIHRHGVSICIS